MAANTKTDLVDMIRAMPDDDVRVAALWTLINGVTVPYVEGATKPVLRRPTKPKTIDGRINVDWIVESRDIAIEMNSDWYAYYGSVWPLYETTIKNLYKEAEQWGINLATYAPETLSLSEVLQMDRMFEAHDKQLDTLATRIKESHETGLRSLPTVKKKRWSQVLRRTASLQRLCREELPATIARKKNPDIHETWRYLHALRYMLYTTRSSMGSKDGSLSFMLIPLHLIEMLMVIQCARMHCESHRIPGVLVQLAPGHGKSSAGVADAALNLCKRPWRTTGVIHNVEDIAFDRTDAIAEHFDDDTPTGRRRKALFPKLSKHKSSIKGKLFLDEDGKKPCPRQEGNLFPNGVHGRKQGISIDDGFFDDPSDEKEQTEAGTRERTNAALEKTWMPRLRGKDAFFVYICTSWHPDDFAEKMKKALRAGEMKLAFYARRCGGPEDGFKPLWREGGYDEEFLKRAYYRKGAADYACIYQQNANSEASRAVTRLHFYDFELYKQWRKEELQDENWKRFFEEALGYLSIDPSGTVNKRSDRFGMTHSRFGILRRQVELSGNEHTLEEPKLVFTQYWSQKASQHDAAALTAEFCKNPGPSNKVDQILVESTSGFHATAEEMVRNQGIDSRKVIVKGAGFGNKVKKLDNVKLHLENGDVLFPGIWGKDEHGERALEIHPMWGPLADQLLQAGTVKEDNLLDCVRQQLEEVSYDIFRAKGLVGPDRISRDTVGLSPARQRMMDFYQGKLKPKTPVTHRPKNTSLCGRKIACLT
jgi:hypothetical protein